MNPWSGLKGLPAESWVLFTATLVNRAGQMVLPFMVLYLTRWIGWSAAQAAVVMAVYGAGSLVTAPLAGKLCDRLGPGRIMTWSLFSSGAILLLFPLARTPAAILPITFILSMASESFRPAVMSSVASAVRPDQLRAAFALNRLAVNAGLSIGPAVGGLLATFDFRALFLVDGLTSILGGLVMVLSPWKAGAPAASPGEGAAADAGGWRGHLEIFSDRRFLYFLAAMLPVLIVFFQHVAAMPLFLVQGKGMSEAAFGLLFTVNTAIIILVEVPLNLSMSGWTHARSMALGAALTGLGFGATGLASGFGAAAASVVIWTFGEMILLPGSNAYVGEIAPARRRGEYMGLYVMCFAFAFSVGPWLGTQVLERAGSAVLWISVCLAGCLSAVLMLRLR